MEGKYSYPNDFVRLRATRHFMERLEERGMGLDSIPTMIKVTENNIYCGDVEEGVLVNVVVRLDYTRFKYIFLCFNPLDGYLKTLWFRDKSKRYVTGKRTTEDSERTVQDVESSNEI